MTDSVPRELPPDVHEAIQGHCEAGDALAASGSYEEAIAEYNLAWALVPTPRTDWNASTWILGALADAFFLGGHVTAARKPLEFSMTCPGGLGNPFLHLRLGQVLFEAGEMDGAADELMRAYMGGGAELFANEDPRYLEFLGTRAIL